MLAFVSSQPLSPKVVICVFFMNNSQAIIEESPNRRYKKVLILRCCEY